MSQNKECQTSAKANKQQWVKEKENLAKICFAWGRQAQLQKPLKAACISKVSARRKSTAKESTAINKKGKSYGGSVAWLALIAGLLVYSLSPVPGMILTNSYCLGPHKEIFSEAFRPKWIYSRYIQVRQVFHLVPDDLDPEKIRSATMGRIGWLKAVLNLLDREALYFGTYSAPEAGTKLPSSCVLYVGLPASWSVCKLRVKYKNGVELNCDIYDSVYLEM